MRAGVVLTAVLAVVGWAGIAMAGLPYNFQISPFSNLAISDGQVDAFTAGTLIGNYDPVTNPGGTRTKPGGIFSTGPGPTENVPVPVTATATGNGAPTFRIGGTFHMNLDFSGGTLIMSDYNSFMNGPPSSGIDASAVFQPQSSFNTRNPTMHYPAVAIEQDLGTATLTAFSAVQTAAANGTLTATGENTFDFSVVVPVEFSGEFNLMDGPLPFGPYAGLLPLSGTITRSGDSANLTAQAALDISQTEHPNEPLPTMPVALPTLTSATADVLVDLIVEQVTLEMAGNVHTHAFGSLAAQILPGDANRDGRVDGEDFLIWQAAFGTQSGATWEDGDFNGDGRVDGEDFLIWQTNFGSAAAASAVTPEPAALGLLLLWGIFCRRRRRRVIG